MRITILSGGLLVASVAFGQPVIAPTDAPVGPRRGQDVDGYNIVNSFELGYRYNDVSGNVGKYRSDVNFGNGIRLLGSSLSVHSKEGHGKYFDELLLNTQGLGNDPYQFSSFRIQKNRLYRYDLLWRENEYYNPALTIAGGQHFLNTSRRLQDHQFVFLPQSSVRLFAGYSRNSQSGPALSTVNLFDSHGGDEFPLFTNVRRLQDEYRFGFQVRVSGVTLWVQRGWEFFRDDTRNESGPLPGIDTGDETTLTSFRRDEPYHGSTDNWRIHLLSDGNNKLYSLNGRFTYAGTRRNFLFDETAFGTDRFGAARNRQVLVAGNGRRPVLAANLTTTLTPAESLTIVNHTAFHHTRMDGDGVYRDVNNGTALGSLLHFQFLGIRTLTTSTDLNYRISPAFGMFTGYQYSNRRVRSTEQLNFGGPVPDRVEGEQTNNLHTGRFGVRFRPVKPLTFVADAEIGRADRPIYPISDRNYHALGGRVRYRGRSLALGAFVRTNYNFNSVSLFSHSSRTRTYAADLSWSARTWVGVDASYSKLHLDTLTGIAYFVNSALVGDQSRYISNIHSGSLALRVSVGPRVDLFAGYVRTQDTGSDEPAAGRLGFQIYPLTYHSPMGRISIRLRSNVRWNAGYQHYGYNESLLPLQNYQARTGFTSLSWSF